MLSNKIFLLKLITTLLLIISSFYFFSSGYYQLQKINLVNKFYNNKIVNKNKTRNYNNQSIENNENIEIFRKDKSLKISNIIPEKIDEEIIITVKKGDIFSKLIDPFIKNKNQKQKIITIKIFGNNKIYIKIYWDYYF